MSGFDLIAVVESMPAAAALAIAGRYGFKYLRERIDERTDQLRADHVDLKETLAENERRNRKFHKKLGKNVEKISKRLEETRSDCKFAHRDDPSWGKGGD